MWIVCGRGVPFLATSPDGLIGEDGLIEVKRPASAADLTPDEVIEKKVGEVGRCGREEQVMMR